MDKCEECFGAANGDCDICPLCPCVIQNEFIDKFNEIKEEYLINVKEREEK